MTEKKVSRAEFIHGVAKGAMVAGGASLIGPLVAHETSMLTQDSFSVDGARFYPLYENHAVGPTYPLPQNATGLFKEFNLNLKLASSVSGEIKTFNIYTDPLEDLQYFLSIYEGNPVPAVQSLLQQVIDQKITLALGDIDIVYNEEISQLFRFDSPADTQRFFDGIKLILFSSLPKVNQQLLEQHLDKKVPRRHFLKLSTLATTAVALGGAAAGAWQSSDTAFFTSLTRDPTLPEPIAKIMLRLDGMVSNYHPEDTIIFMRNVIMALKIRELAEFQKTAIKTPIIGFEVGSLHSGLEDMMHLPLEVLRQLFVRTNPAYTREAIRKHGANLASTRLIQADASGVFRDLPPIIDTRLLDLLGIPR